MNAQRHRLLPCPDCQSRLQRVQRTFTDRVLSLFTPVVRYRCTAAACGWSGRLPRPDSQRKRSVAHYVPRIVLDPARGVGQEQPARRSRG